MSDADWLAEVFKQAEREYRELPEWARPVLTPPVDAAGDEDVDTEASAASPCLRETEV